MRKITPTEDIGANDSGVTLSLSPEQLKALGLRKLPAAGDTVQLRATATVRPSLPDAHAPHTGPADPDADGDDDAAPDDADAARDADPAQDAKGDGDAPGSLTLHLTGLTLTQPHRAPDKVLYGSGD